MRPTTGTANKTHNAINIIEHKFGLVNKSVLQKIKRIQDKNEEIFICQILFKLFPDDIHKNKLKLTSATKQEIY